MTYSNQLRSFDYKETIATFARTCRCGLGMDTRPQWDAMFRRGTRHAMGSVDTVPPAHLRSRVARVMGTGPPLHM